MISRDGSAFEKKFITEVANFKNGKTGVSPEDIEAAIILKEVLERLYAGEIHQAGELGDEPEFEDLFFQ